MLIVEFGEDIFGRLGRLELERSAQNANLVAVHCARLEQFLFQAQAIEAMLQERQRLVVFPVGLHNHALDLHAFHAEDAIGKFAHGIFAVALFALVLPNLVVLNLTFLGFFGSAAQLEYLVGDGVDK